MASVAALRDGLKARLATIAGLYTHDTIPSQVTPPAAQVGVPTSIRYDFAMRSAVATYLFPIRVLAGMASEAEAQDAIDGYISPNGATSIRAAIDGDTTLGGIAHTSRLVEARDYGVYEVGGVPYLGAELLVEVIA